MSTRKFARWIQLVARWSPPEPVRFRLLVDLTGRECVAVIEYGGGTAQVQVEAATPVRQVLSDLDEVLARLVVATARREAARARRRRAAYGHLPAPN